MNSFDITLFVVAYVVLLVLLVALLVGTTHMLRNSKLSEKYKQMNDKFMCKSRDKKNG